MLPPGVEIRTGSNIVKITIEPLTTIYLTAKEASDLAAALTQAAEKAEPPSDQRRRLL
jgi:hypothetical protein